MTHSSASSTVKLGAAAVLVLSLGAAACSAKGEDPVIVDSADGGPLINPTDRDRGGNVVCDPVTGECSCIRIGMLGRLPSYGAVPGQDNTAALQAWLNEKSTAEVDVHTTAVALTPEFLGQYDVLILQALEDQEGGPQWSYTPAAAANLEAWVRNGGGLQSAWNQLRW